MGEHIEAAGGQHPVSGGDVQVTFPRVLRQVADRAAAGHGAGVGRALAGENPQGGGFAGAVAADERDSITRLDAEVGVGEQDPRGGPQFKAGCSDHVM